MPNNPSREAFERWAEANGYVAFNDDDDQYSNADTHHAWLGWQAGAQAERERAAKICEAESQLGLDDERSYYGNLMAQAIRDRSAP
jgi:hypothetical protein